MSNLQTEKRVLLSVLKLTRDSATSIEVLKSDLNVPVSVVHDYLKKSADKGLLRISNTLVEASSQQRVAIAVEVASLGGDLEAISRILGWSEFESLVAMAFENNDFRVAKHFRFSSKGRRWEVDLLATHKPFLVLVECKRWLRGTGPAAIKVITENHVAKTQALIEELPHLKEKAGLKDWDHATLVPILTNLTQSQLRFYLDVPIVAVLQLPSFLSELVAYVPTLLHFKTDFLIEEKK